MSPLTPAAHHLEQGDEPHGSAGWMPWVPPNCGTVPASAAGTDPVLRTDHRLARTGRPQVEAEGEGVSIGRCPSLTGLDRVARLLTFLKPFC